MAWKRSWTEAELTRLRELTAQGLKPSRIAPLFGRSALSVRDRIKYDRIQRGEPRKGAVNYVTTETAQHRGAADGRSAAGLKRLGQATSLVF